MPAISDVYVDIGARTTALGRGLEKAKAMLKSFGNQKEAGGKKDSGGGMLSGLKQGGLIGAGMKAFDAAYSSIQSVGAAIAESSRMGADLNETLSKTGVLMGDATADAVKFASELQDSGQGQMQGILESLTGSALAMKGLGTETGKAIDLAKQLETRVGDIASQDNLSPERVRQAIQSAMSGEFDPLKDLKVYVNADDLKKTGLPLGEAIASEFLLQTERAKGDFARTRLSTSNMQRTNSNSIETMMTKFGQAIQPVTQAFAYLQSVVLTAIGGIGFDGFTGFIDQMRNTIVDMADGLAAAVVGVIIPMGQGLMMVGGWFMSILSSVGGFFRDAIIGFGGFQGIFGRMGVELAYRLAQGIDLLMQPFRWIAKQMGISLGEGMTGIVESLGQRREQMDQEAGDKIAEANAKRDADKAAMSAALKLDVPTGKGAIGEMPGKAMPAEKEKDKGPQRTAFSALLNNAQGEDKKQTGLLGQIAVNTSLKNLNAEDMGSKLTNAVLPKDDAAKLMSSPLATPEAAANTSAKAAIMNGKGSETTGTPATDETLKMIAQLIATALGGSKTGAVDMATKKPGPDRSPQLVGA